MTKTNHLTRTTSSDLRPPAYGFESLPHDADRAIALAVVPNASSSDADSRLDHFVQQDDMLFAGTHLIVDLWHASKLDDLQIVEQALRDAAKRRSLGIYGGRSLAFSVSTSN